MFKSDQSLFKWFHCYYTFHLRSSQVTGHKAKKVYNEWSGIFSAIKSKHIMKLIIKTELESELRLQTRLFFKIGELKEFSPLHLMCKSEAFFLKSAESLVRFGSFMAWIQKKKKSKKKELFIIQYTIIHHYYFYTMCHILPNNLLNISGLYLQPTSGLDHEKKKKRANEIRYQFFFSYFSQKKMM